MEHEISEHTLRLEREFEELGQIVREELSGWHWIDHSYQQHLPFMDSLRSVQYRPWGSLDSQLHHLMQYAHRLNVAGASYSSDSEKSLNRASNCNKKRIAFKYGKSMILRSWAMTAVESLMGHSGMCLERYTGIQVYDPVQEKYLLYFGSGLGCNVNTNIKVADGPPNQSTFVYTPQRAGVDSIRVAVQHCDYGTRKYVIDTIYYSIKVVASPRS
jgi:hypothetical protein